METPTHALCAQRSAACEKAWLKNSKTTTAENKLSYVPSLEGHDALPPDESPYYVKDFLGHKSLSSTEIYMNIERTMFESACDEFTVKVTEKPQEVKALLEAGFEYICQKDDLPFFRKRK